MILDTRKMVRAIFLGIAILSVWAAFGLNEAHAATISKPTQSLGLVGYWSFDVGKGGAKAVDMSGNGNNGTLTNMNNAGAWVGGKIGNALNFDGVDDVVSANQTGLGTTAFTISAWIKASDAHSQQGIVEAWSNGGYKLMGPDSSGTIYVGYRKVGGTYSGANASGATLNVWHHVTATFDGSTKIIVVYVDGVAGTPVVGNDESFVQTTARIGYNSDNTRYFNGLIDEVRVYNRALSAEEIKRLYRQTSPQMNASQANKLRQGLVGMWTFDENDMSGNTAIDRSGQGNNGTLTNGPTRQIGKIGQALNFDGSNDYVDAGKPASIRVTSGLTFSAWVKMPATSNRQAFIARGTEAAFMIEQTTSKLRGYATNSGGSAAESFHCTGGTAIDDNVFHHVSVTYDTSIWRAYVDGVQNCTGTGVTGTLKDGGTENTTIGYYNGSLEYGIGLIDEVRIYNRALTPAEIRQLYKAGSSFHPNTTNKSNLRAGLVGHWSFDENDMGTTSAADVSGSGNTGWLINGVKKSIGRIGQGLSFNGVNNYVNAGDTNNYFGGNFTVSVWINSMVKNWHYVLGNGIYNVQDAFGIVERQDQPSIGIGVYYDAGPVQLGSGINSKGTWRYVTVTYDNSSVKIYIDGVYKASGSRSGTFVSGNLKIGTSGDSRYFNGTIDEVRIYNRVLSPDEIKRLYNMGR